MMTFAFYPSNLIEQGVGLSPSFRLSFIITSQLDRILEWRFLPNKFTISGTKAANPYSDSLLLVISQKIEKKSDILNADIPVNTDGNQICYHPWAELT